MEQLPHDVPDHHLRVLLRARELFVRPGKEVNLFFLGASKAIINIFRGVVLLSIAVGAIAALAAVWSIADVAMALMAIVNLVAISLLGKWAFGAFTDYQRQETAGQDPIFVADGNTDLPGELPGDVWNAANGRIQRAGRRLAALPAVM